MGPTVSDALTLPFIYITDNSVRQVIIWFTFYVTKLLKCNIDTMDKVEIS